MQLDLTKGMNLDLSKNANTVFEFGLAWKPAETGAKIDVDASAFLLKPADGKNKLLDIRDVVYHQKDTSWETHPSGSIKLSPDNTDGVNKADQKYDETLTIDTSKIPSDISQVNIYINIFKPAVTFGKIKDCFVDVVDADGVIIANFNMSEQLRDENSLLVGTLSKSGSAWNFTAKGEGYVITDLNDIVQSLNQEGC